VNVTQLDVLLSHGSSAGSKRSPPKGLDGQSEVKLHGVTVGGIDSVGLDTRGRAVVKFHLQRGIRLPNDTVAAVEPVSVFGPKDLSLEPGAAETSGPYLADGATVSHTQDPQEISDMAKPLSQLTSEVDPQELAGLVHTAAQGLQGEGPALRRTVVNGGSLVDQAYGRRDQLRQSLQDLELLAGTFSGRGGQLTTLAGNLGTLSSLAGQDKIDQLLDGVSRLSRTTSHLLGAQGTGLGHLLDSSSGVVGVLSANRTNIPVLFDGLNSLLGGLGNVIRYPGPNGTQLGNVGYTIDLDLCYEIRDLCPTLPH
jgi:phospholipid/cholesterol/gamma-HCH transport system substrate-binding protein